MAQVIGVVAPLVASVGALAHTCYSEEEQELKQRSVCVIVHPVDLCHSQRELRLNFISLSNIYVQANLGF